MSDEIINFYKKVSDTEEPQKPIEEQKETPAPVLPQPDEPFDKFLLELAEKLKNEKVITEKQQETFEEQIKQPVLEEDKNSDDPFKKFIGSFANIIKQDELVNREENIKEATISFINKLKEQPEEPFIIADEPIVKGKKKKYLPSKIQQKVQKLPRVIKIEEPVVAEQADKPVKEMSKDENKYVQELKTADKSNKKLPEKIKSVSDIKSIVEKQVAEILSRYPNLGFTGGGGGTNAVQYAEGGTMRGDLNVTGKYLSGGVDISTLFGSGGGAVSGIPDRLISGSQSLILNTDGSISFPDNFITAPDGEVLNIQSETVSPSSFSRISLSPYAFFAYDNEGNSISFDVVDNTIELISQNEYSWKFNNQGVLVGPGNTLTVTSLSSLGKILSGGKDLLDIFALSGTGGGGTGRDDVNTIVISNSANWNTAYNTATAYSSVSSSFATITALNSVSSLLTPLTLTNTLTGQLVTNTTFNSYRTSVAASTATLLPTSIYQSASGNWQSTYTTVQSNSSNWQKAYETATTYQSTSGQFALSAHGYTHLNVSKAFFSGDITTQPAYASFSGTLVDDITITIVADNPGTAGNSAYLYFNGNTNVDTAIYDYNQDNPSNTITLTSGDGQLTPEADQEVSLSGGIDSETVYIVINANNYGSAGNNISLTFDGSTTIGTALTDWNTANPTNKAALGIENTGAYYSSLIPDSSVVITLSSGVDGIDPVFNQNLNTTDTVRFSSILVGLDNVDPNSPNNKLQTSSLTVLGQDAVGGAVPTTTIKGGMFLGKADGSIGMLTNTNNYWGPSVFEFAGVNANVSQYNNIYFNAGLFPQLWLSTSGNVGIHTAYPNERLTVKGNISATNTVYANNYLSAGVNLLDIFSGGGGGGDPAVNTIVSTTSATWNNTTTIVQNNSASWFEPVRRFDYVTVANIDYSYSGTAPYGTFETNPIWKLTRLTYNNNGTISNQASAINSWTGRLTATYV